MNTVDQSEEQMRITIAIDGFASCGKSTLARELAAKLNYAYVDSGAMYRAVTLFFLENEIDYNQPEVVETALPRIKITFRNIEGQNTTFLNGKNVEKEIREMVVSQHVSPVAAISSVRKAMVSLQQELGIAKGIVMDGRDIGTVVFPNAELKLFMTASMEVRTQRRLKEMVEKGTTLDSKAVLDNLMQRDHIDSTRSDSPLRKASDAIEIDNSFLSPKEQLDVALRLAAKAILADA